MTIRPPLCLLISTICLIGCQQESIPAVFQTTTSTNPSAFDGSKAGDQREVGGIKLCWCPAGKFTMGSPRSEPERRPGEDQVEVTLGKGFWMAQYETK